MGNYLTIKILPHNTCKYCYQNVQNGNICKSCQSAIIEKLKQNGLL